MAATAAIMDVLNMLLLDPTTEDICVSRRGARLSCISGQRAFVSDARIAVCRIIGDFVVQSLVVLDNDVSLELPVAVHMNQLLPEDLTFVLFRVVDVDVTAHA